MTADINKWCHLSLQTQSPFYKQQSASDYMASFNLLPCGDKTKGKNAITPPAITWQVIDATNAKFVPVFEVMQTGKLDKNEEPVCIQVDAFITSELLDHVVFH